MNRRSFLLLAVVMLGAALPPVYAQPEVVAAECLDISSLGNPILDLFYLRIDSLWHEGKYEQVFPLFYLITRLDPGDMEAWASGSWMLVQCIAPTKTGAKEKEKYVEKGIAFLKEGISHVPDDYRLHWELGWLYYQRKEYKLALDSIDKSIAYEHPFYVETTRAHVLTKLGRREDALAQWIKVRDKYPDRKDVAERFIRDLEGNDSGPDR